MFKSRFTATLLAFSAIAGLHTAGAQQDAAQQENDQARQRPAATAQDQDQDRQPARPLQQAQPGQQIQPGQQVQPGQQLQTLESEGVEARRIATPAPGQDLPLTEALAKKLIKANEAEIELAKFAQQKSDHPEIKQLTQTLIDDHQKFIQQLQPLAQTQRQSNPAADQRRGGASDRAQNAQPNAQQDATSQRADNRGTSQQADKRGAAGTRTAAAQTVTVPKELCQLMDQACDNALAMTKEILQNQEGQDFQMAFLSQQAVAHVHMLAELKAIQSSGPQELQPIAEQAIGKTQQHLEQTRQLAKKLEDKERSTR